MMDRPLLYDVCCCEGGATKGYQRAGFRVIGIDCDPQPRYVGDGFLQMDALEFLDRYLAGEFERATAFAASPPCQFASEATPMAYRANHPNLIPGVRERLLATGLPYAIENVENARKWLRQPLMLCGSMFGLNIWRHRYFEMSEPVLLSPMTCDHSRRPIMTHPGSHSRALGPVLVSGTTRRRPAEGGRFEFSVTVVREAMGAPWMSRHGLDEAIPPVFTQHIGGYLMAAALAQREASR